MHGQYLEFPPTARAEYYDDDAEDYQHDDHKIMRRGELLLRGFHHHDLDGDETEDLHDDDDLDNDDTEEVETFIGRFSW